MSDDQQPKQKRPKGFQKGHKYHAPRAKIMSTRHLASEIRGRIPAEIYVDYRLAIASGKAAKLGEDEDGQLCVLVDEHGMPPTQEQISQAMDWLATRGYGQAPQMLHVENIHRLELSGAPVIDLASKYSPAKLAQIRALLALPAGSASQPGQQPAASNDQPASTDLEPELADREPEVEDADFTMQDAIDDDATSG